MGPIWGRQDPGGPHVGPMNFAIWVSMQRAITLFVSQWWPSSHRHVHLFVTSNKWVKIIIMRYPAWYWIPGFCVHVIWEWFLQSYVFKVGRWQYQRGTLNNEHDETAWNIVNLHPHIWWECKLTRNYTALQWCNGTPIQCQYRQWLKPNHHEPWLFI